MAQSLQGFLSLKETKPSIKKFPLLWQHFSEISSHLNEWLLFLWGFIFTTGEKIERKKEKHLVLRNESEFRKVMNRANHKQNSGRKIDKFINLILQRAFNNPGQQKTKSLQMLCHLMLIDFKRNLFHVIFL